jgi:hypothetical protein
MAEESTQMSADSMTTPSQPAQPHISPGTVGGFLVSGRRGLVPSFVVGESLDRLAVFEVVHPPHAVALITPDDDEAFVGVERLESTDG